MAADAAESSSPLAPRTPHFAPKAKRVIHLFMNGGPSPGRHVRPQARADQAARQARAQPPADRAEDGHGVQVAVLVQEVRPERARGQRDLRERRRVRRRPLRDPLDDADVPNHEPSFMLMNCGEARQPRPCMGSWVTLRPGHREPEPARLHRRCAPAATRPRRRRTGSRPSCPAPTRRPTSTPRTTEFERLIPHIRDRSARPDGPARPARPAPRAEPRAPGRAAPARATSKPASSRSSWPTGCRPRPTDAFDVSQRAASTSARCTAPASTPGSC